MITYLCTTDQLAETPAELEDCMCLKTALRSASGIAWDGFHEILILMDDHQLAYQDADPEKFALVPVPGASLELLQSWWDESSTERVIYAVSTPEGIPFSRIEQRICCVDSVK